MSITFHEGAEYTRHADGSTTAGVENHGPEFPVGSWIRFYIASADVNEAVRLLEGGSANKLEAFQEMLRRHAMDWGQCCNPRTCVCSHASALRLLSLNAGAA